MKIKLAGHVVVVETNLSKEEILKIKKARPNALCVMDEETKKAIYGISYKECKVDHGTMNDFGITFDSETPDGAHHACITWAYPEDVVDVKGWVRDFTRKAVLYLGKIEEQCAKALEEIADEDALVDAAIVNV